ncbi:MAG: hypothetical protein ACLQBJ_02535 [Bryobacteraceae bacterium]
MKKAMIVCIWALLSNTVNGQADPGALEQTVRVSLYGVGWEGQRVKEMRRGGDAVAVALTKIIGEKILDDKQVEVALDILQTAFADLSAVPALPDREPRAALFVLRSFDGSAHDPTLRNKIAVTRKMIVDAFARLPSN